MDIRFCEACEESIPDADFALGRARSVGGVHTCATCLAAAQRPLAAAAPAGGIELRFCDACHESIPEADIALGKARSAAGRTTCAACLALERLGDTRPAAGGAAERVPALDLLPPAPSATRPGAPAVISFCSGCGQSIAPADLASGKAVSAQGRQLCPPCVARRLLAPARRGAPLATLLALAALGVAGWLLVERLRPAPSAGVTPAVAEAIRAQSVQTLADARRAQEERLAALERQQGASGQQARSLETLRSDLQALAERAQADQASVGERLERGETSLRTVDARVRQVYDWLRELQARASGQPGSRSEPARTRPAEAPAPGPSAPSMPVPGSPAPSTPAPATPPAPVPAAPTADDSMLQHWVGLLKDPNAGIAFSATLKLAELKDLRAVGPLLAALKAHRDFYVRLGAADALRELKACDAVPGLVEALDDKDELVQTAAQQALIAITGHQEPFQAGQPKNELKRAQKAWGAWWKDNEVSVRTRLGQLKG